MAAIAFALFAPTLGHQFLNWDDPAYVTEDPYLEPAWLLSHFYYYAYIPVTMLSHTLDVSVWGMSPPGHHLTNVLLHAANAVWIVLLGLTIARPRSGPSRASNGPWLLAGVTIGTLVFAVHPLRAESVSWISDRKDLLCTFFFLPAVMAYLKYSSAREGRARTSWYLTAFVLSVLSVLSKSIAVGFPLVLLVLDWMLPGGKPKPIRARLLEKVPFFAVSLGISLLSVAQSPDAKRAYAVAHLSGIEQILFPFYCLAFSVYKTLAPVHLSPIYPRVDAGTMAVGLAFVVLTTGLCVYLAKRGSKGPLLAWLVYLLLLVPNVAGLSSGMQPVADRYSYLSTIGFYLLLGFGVARALVDARPSRRLLVVSSCGTLILVLTAMTSIQAARWKTSTSLWEYVIHNSPHKPDYTDAYVNLASAYADEGRRGESRAVLERAVTIDPGSGAALYNLGVLAYLDRDRDRAADYLRRATKVDPKDAKSFYNLAIVLGELGRDTEAVPTMIEAARLGSDDAKEALRSRGLGW